MKSKYQKTLTCTLAAVGFALLTFSGSTFAQGQEKSEICHVEGNGSYHPISIADPAYDAHIEHGDWEITNEIEDGLDNNCDGRVDECVQIRHHCSAGSTVLQTICGPGEQVLNTFPAENISYVTFLGDTSSVILNHQVDGSALSGQSLEITESTNLCGLEGGASGDPRWNDEVSSVEIQ